MIEGIDPAKYNYECFIVGGGSSLKNFNWEILDDPNKFVIAINNAFMVLPNAQILYCTDDPWINENQKLLEKFKGFKWQGTLSPNPQTKNPVIDKQWHLTGKDGLETKEGCLRHGSNSTYAAINLAAIHLGFNKIFLLGIDMQWGEHGNKNTSHWHSDFKPHSRVDYEAAYFNMLENFRKMSPLLKTYGKQVYNVNRPEKTRLDAFPLISFKEVFKRDDIFVNNNISLERIKNYEKQ